MLLEWNEQIKAHLMWIWGGEDGFMKRKKEGMLVVTERNLIFITKTNMSYRIHDVHSRRQLLRFKENKDVFLPLEGYGITELRNDIEKSDQNIVFTFAQISEMYFLEKRWGEISRKRSHTVSTCRLESNNSFIQNVMSLSLLLFSSFLGFN